MPLLHPLFCDHAVLQRDVRVPVWGWADSGAKVTVIFGGQSESTLVNGDGKWMVYLKPMPASTKSRALIVKSPGHSPVTVHDILVGDVWLCSGQSNMEMGIGLCSTSNDVATAGQPLLRLLAVPKRSSPEPQALLDCHWSACTPQTVMQGGWRGFSAVAFYFGRQIQQELNVPVGLIHASWGGSTIAAWSTKESLLSPGDFTSEAPSLHRPIEQHNPTYLYNGMISPLLPFAIKGAIWYQGEADAKAGHAMQYQHLLSALIGDWRAGFGVGDFPFYIVSLAAYQATNATPQDSSWAELREAQAVAAASVKNSGLAVTIDIGDAKNLHPKNKKAVGERLALIALAQTYGRKLEYSGPVFRSMTAVGAALRLNFDHADSGLMCKGETLTGFAIAGQDHKFVWAEAKIEGNTVILSAPTVSKPVAARYAWDSNPVCNFYNQAGLPAVPFRTDRPEWQD